MSSLSILAIRVSQLHDAAEHSDIYCAPLYPVTASESSINQTQSMEGGRLLLILSMETFSSNVVEFMLKRK